MKIDLVGGGSCGPRVEPNVRGHAIGWGRRRGNRGEREREREREKAHIEISDHALHCTDE